ncbi:GH-E family nuclease [Bacillus pseudomycoides]|uniref:GH-E family nuclease n=2 Tax=Bacillus pseudomycoides TaxID=64104 RepID=UPI003D1ED088
MNLNMYLGEVQSQTQSMNAVCTTTIQGMEQAIQSIDAFAIDTVLQGQTYSSAKSFFVQTFRPLAQGIIFLCEELIRQNDAFPSQFQSKVASTDVIEQELREQIREIDRMKTSMEAVSQAMPLPGMDAMANLFTAMRHKLQEKLDHLHEFNQTSSNNYSTAIQLAASIATGLAEVQSGKGFSLASGTFSTQGLNMEWTASIQAIEEDRKRQADNLLNGSSIEEGAMCGPLNSEKKDESLLDKFKHGVEDIYEIASDFIQGAGSAVAEDYIGLTPPDNDKLESNATYQAGRFTGHVLSTVGSIVEIFEGISVIGGANFLTFVAEVGSGGLASPIVLPLDAVATAAGLGAVRHGGFVLNKSIQNAQDTLQKFQSSSPSGGSSSSPSTWNEFQTANKGKYSKDEMSKAWDKYKKENGIESDSGDKTYTRPSGFRKGVRDKVWDNAKDENGHVKDPINNEIMNKGEPWDMGHLPGYEFRKHKKSAEERGITREQFLDEHNNPDHYRPELPSSNRSHKGEDLTDDYFGD